MHSSNKISAQGKNRKVRSLYIWLSKVTKLDGCWIEDIDDHDKPVWACIKHIFKNIFFLKSIKIGSGIAIAGALVIIQPKVAYGQIPLGGLNGTNGFVVNGRAANAQSGYSNSIGDINGDGINDILVGSPFADPNGEQSGELFVVFGRSQGFMAEVDPSTLDGTNGFIIKGAAPGRYTAFTVKTSDINGDGIDDMHLTVRGYSFAGVEQEAITIFGSSNGFPECIDLSEQDIEVTQISFNQLAAGSELILSQATGDFNGDGVGDLGFGIPDKNPMNLNNAGMGYILFGSSTLESNTTLDDLDGTAGFGINGGWANALAGVSMSSGDVNGDGYADIMMGAPGAAPNMEQGAGTTHIIFGCSTLPICDAPPQKGNNAHATGSAFDLSSINGTNGFTINGIASGDGSGTRLASGDVNGDGFADVIIAAPYADPNGVGQAGETYVVFGKSGGFGSVFELSDLDGVNGFRLNGIGIFNFSGLGLASGDINDDGFDEVMVGAPRASVGDGGGAGQTYVVYGKSDTFASSIDFSSLEASTGFSLDGANAYDGSGISVSAGDINGDGADDIVIGAYGASSNNLTYSGETYVYFGTPNLQVSNEEDSDIPTETMLAQNFPNPFNPTTTISFTLPQASEVQLQVYDLLGRQVATLVNSRQAAGEHSVNFDASGLSSGIYIYRLQAGSSVLTRKLTLIK